MKKIIFSIIFLLLSGNIIKAESLQMSNEIPNYLGAQIINQGKEAATDLLKALPEGAKKEAGKVFEEQKNIIGEQIQNESNIYRKKIILFLKNIIIEIKNRWQIGSANILEKLPWFKR
ncbi:MAG: hypothetical protein COU81_02725 [Candidatus Portnoybacteria bacterium CG10_big_fil_rev_8_21_14_0_10_36_7]|uniref:Uncharacterized protein n=1 Tax=Candidatus Portnoybacteria bacterium CG10_big_fil_rev_8_21_14_0_10_36_7 TaxID=1974812 RepID=A0A2M8KDR7_9BACT|nr:MAG: hypothetical protein COU81_02725 [Candidatus Portnoybacteria bacterium CG10_big_fil_rev_8_21_14_0_10_36_7]